MMRLFLWCGFRQLAFLWLVLSLVSKVTAQQVPTESGKLAALVEQLGDPSFPLRREAAEEIAEHGIEAHSVLMAGLEHLDPQVRRSCQRLLGDILELRYQRRLEEFVKGASEAGSEQDERVPCWDRYRALIGDDPAARKLFVMMHRAEPGLMSSAAAGSDAAGDATSVRISQIYRMMYQRETAKRQQPSLGTIAAVTFVSCDPELELPPELLNNSLFASFIQQSTFRNAIAKGEVQEPAKKLLGRWVLRPSGLRLLQTKLTMAMQYDVPEGLELGLRTVGQKQGIIPGYRVYGLHAIGRLGGKPHVARLVELLEDNTECTRRVIRRNNKTQTISIQTRDIALAWLIYLTGQSHTDYSMPAAKTIFERVAKTKTYTVSISSLYFDSNESRPKAMEKFRKWLAENPLPVPPPIPESAEQMAVPPALLAAGMNNVNPFGKAPATEVRADDVEGLEPADRLLARQLTRSRKLLANGNFADGTRILGLILANEADYTIKENRDSPLAQGLKAEAERVLRSLPAAGREAYELQFGSDAQRLLDQALADGDVAKMLLIADRYAATKAGQHTLFLLGTHFLNRNHPLRAGHYFQRVRQRSADPQRYEPELSIRLAACWLLAGLGERSERVLLGLKKRYPQASVSLQGQQLPLFQEPGEALGWLAGLLHTEAVQPGKGDWLVYRGNGNRNQRVPPVSPYLSAEPIAAVADVKSIVDQATTLQKGRLEGYSPALPSCSPLVIGNLIVFRTATHLKAYDLEHKQITWSALLDDSLSHAARQPKPADEKTLASFYADGLKRRLWQDFTFGNLASDGQRVYVLEDLNFGGDGNYRRLVVMPDGKRRLDANAPKSANILSAFDLKTGKLLWEIGGPKTNASRPQAGLFFLGPPLPLGGRLYVIGDERGEARLLELDAVSGEVIWEFVLGEPDQIANYPFSPTLPAWLSERDSHRSGASPSCADGILVCPISTDRYLGLDLTARKILWVYELPYEETRKIAAGFAGINPWQQRLYEKASERETDHWADGSVSLAGGRALLTPIRSGKLLCLELASGKMLWSASRRDGMYVAGVTEGKVVVVGHSKVWALRLEDGQPVWERDIPLPPGSLPAGRGYLSEQHYYLPLTTAEVAVVDLEIGRIVARSRSLDGLRPGNLIPTAAGVVSQSIEGIWHFEGLQQRQDRFATAVQESDDPEALTNLGEVLLFQGQIEPALEQLVASVKKRPNKRNRRLLAEALVDGLQIDFTRYNQRVATLEPLLGQDGQLVDYTRYLAVAYQQAGNLPAAFDKYLQLVANIPEDPPLEFVAAALQVRQDRWLHARLREVWDAATPPQRAQMDARLRTQFDTPERWLRFMADHPQAMESRAQLAEKAMQAKQWLEAERHYRVLLEQELPTHRRLAIARLAELLLEMDRPHESQRFVRILESELADQPCVGEQTGKAIAARLQADQRIEPARFEWEQSPVTAKSNTAPLSYPYRYVIEAQPTGTLAPRANYMIDSTGRNLLGNDAWGRNWHVSLGTITSRIGYSSTTLTYAHGGTHGHILVCWLGARVCAIDMTKSGGKLLWTKQTITQPTAYAGMVNPMAMQFRTPRTANDWPGSMAHRIVVSEHTVCFLQDQRLLAVDLLSGKPAWSREGVSASCDLFTDGDRLFVTPGDQEEALVLNLIDGSELGERPVAPFRQRMLVVQGKQLLWEKTAEGLRRLRLFDPWTQETVWGHDFPSKDVQVSLIRGRSEVATLDRQGRLRIFAISDGKPLLEKQLPAQPKLDGLLVMASDTRYEVVGNEPVGANPAVNGLNILNLSRLGAASVPVNGEYYCLDRATGAEVWKRRVEDLAVDTSQPSELPLVAFVSQYRKLVGTSSRSESRLLAVDRRNGKTLHDQVVSSTNYGFAVEAKPQAKQVNVHTRRLHVTITFGDPPPKTPAQLKAEKEQAAEKEAATKEAATKEAASDEVDEKEATKNEAAKKPVAGLEIQRVRRP